eukprot:TRINITY_DN223_c0_g3_i4.p1 TRINITY_DN223_c0_g3~~TRINITY_DN223_c0_g3_i4.p1  ORF type:complete len:575 (+),score=132.51 TRINITY_DN223_c0_g3_i4:66-1790(+)
MCIRDRVSTQSTWGDWFFQSGNTRMLGYGIGGPFGMIPQSYGPFGMQARIDAPPGFGNPMSQNLIRNQPLVKPASLIQGGQSLTSKGTSSQFPQGAAQRLMAQHTGGMIASSQVFEAEPKRPSDNPVITQVPAQVQPQAIQQMGSRVTVPQQNPFSQQKQIGVFVAGQQTAQKLSQHLGQKIGQQQIGQQIPQQQAGQQAAQVNQPAPQKMSQLLNQQQFQQPNQQFQQPNQQLQLQVQQQLAQQRLAQQQQVQQQQAQQQLAQQQAQQQLAQQQLAQQQLAQQQQLLAQQAQQRGRSMLQTPPPKRSFNSMGPSAFDANIQTQSATTGHPYLQLPAKINAGALTIGEAAPAPAPAQTPAQLNPAIASRIVTTLEPQNTISTNFYQRPTQASANRTDIEEAHIIVQSIGPGGVVRELETNGDLYEGTKKDGERHGQGKLFTREGILYIGEWKHGKREGLGRFFSSRLVFEGEWKDDHWHGHGTLTNRSSEYFADNFDYSDFGKLGDRWSSYRGDFHEGVKEGKGTLVLSNGERFEGSFMADAVHGEGTFTRRSGETVRAEWSRGYLIRTLALNE